MHQASLIGEYVHDSTDYGWAKLEQGLRKSRLFSLVQIEMKIFFSSS